MKIRGISKISKRLFACMMALIMIISTAFTAFAAGTKQNFPLMSATGALVADENTLYLTTFVQDPATKLITATVEVHNNSTGASANVMTGVGLEITFSNKIAPYSYDPANVSDPHPYDATRLYTGGASTNVNTFRQYCYTPISNFNTLGSTVIQNDNARRMVGAKLSAGDDTGTVSIAPGTSRELIRFYFMPMNGTDVLSLDMFSYKWEVAGLNRLSTWIGNGSRLVVSNELFPSTGYLYVHSPNTFKINVKHAKPTGLSAHPDKNVREIIGYVADSMEWATDEAGPYMSGVPNISDDAQVIYVRMKGDANYSGADAEYGNYKKYIASDAVPVYFEDAFFSSDTYANKTSENMTPSDGRTHVGDTLKYTITAGNQGDYRSVWTGVTVTDQLPEGVTFVANSVKINNATVAYTYNGASRTLSVNLGDIPGGTEKVLTFEVKVDDNAHGKTIKNSALVSGKDGEDGQDIDKPITEPGDGHEIVLKSEDPIVDPITEGDREITGEGEPGATIEVEFPDGSKETTIVDEDGYWTVPVPDDVDLVEDDEITVIQTEPDKEPSDPVDETVVGRPAVVPNSTKISRNLTRDDGTHRVGDTFEYTITAKNDGDAKSLWKNVVVTDTMPTQVDFVPGTVKIDGVPAGLAADYDVATRTLTVTLGNMPGGTYKVITFETVVNESAYGQTVKNAATIKGDGGVEEIEEPGDPKEIVDKTEKPVINPITEGDRTVTGTGEPGAEVVVTFPGGGTATGTVDGGGNWSVDVPSNVDLKDGNEVTAVQTAPGKETSDPETETVGGRPSVGEGNALLEKYSVNKTRDDGTTRVGDTLEYTVKATNNGPAKSLWANAVMTDVLPEGITLVPGSVKIGNDTVSYTYDEGTRLLTVVIGDIEAGVTKTITFSATVDGDAHGKLIKNHVKVSGKDGNENGNDLDKEVDEDGGGKVIIDKSPMPELDEINEGDRIITGTGVPGATIKVTIPDRAATVDTEVQPDGTWTVTVPKNNNLVEGDKVYAVQIVSDLEPSDAAEEEVQAKKTVIPFMEKTSENISSNDEYTHVGDTIKYTITVRNDGSSKSVWTDVTITDALPDYVTIVQNSVRLNGAVPTYFFYNTDNRTLYVSAGNLIGGGEAKVLTFKVTIDEDAYGQHIVNGASVNGGNNGVGDIGTETEDEGGQKVRDKSEDPTVDDITRGDETITGKGEPGAEIEVTFPNGDKETTIVDEEGNWSVDVPDDVELENDDKIIVVQTEEGKDPSNEVEAIVGDKDYRAVTGLVYPMVSYDLDLGDWFLRSHDIVVELRATYQTEASPELSTTAVFEGDDQGRFTIENVPFGDYLLYIKRPGFLARCMYITISAEDADIIELTPPGGEGRFNLWFGDVNDDMLVDNLDIMMILEYMELEINALDSRYYAACDLNADGLIDNLDIMMVLENLDKNILQYPGSEDVDPFS